MSALTTKIVKRNLRLFFSKLRRCLPVDVKYSTSKLNTIPIYHKATQFSDNLAICDNVGNYSYGNISIAAHELSQQISKRLGDKVNSQVLFLCPNNVTHVITQWAIWMSGHVAVPVSSLHPQNMIEYYAKDSDSKLLITTPEHAEIMHKVSTNTKKMLMVLDNKLREDILTIKDSSKHEFDALQSNSKVNSNAMIIYTSGTTGYPKGVVLTHNNILSQINTLVDAWRWTSNDVILHTLPLHHVHGIVNALLCPLYVGAKCIMLPKFDANSVWEHLLGIKTKPDCPKPTVFMAVPTIYTKLIDEFKTTFQNNSKINDYIKTNLKSKIRLMVSGSAPLSVPLFQKWLDITGHKLLERYGMSEIGMCLSHQYDSDREPGYVGVPLKGCSVRLSEKNEDGSYKTLMECTNVNDNIKVQLNTEVTGDTIIGELHVYGNSVFKEYYNKPDITQSEFTNDRWFKTGDTCEYSIKKKLFKILGRTSLDIIKTGGYKISALDIETQLLHHPNVVDSAVVGIPDDEWGQIVAALIVLDKDIPVESLQLFLKTKIANYAVPKIMKVTKAIPKNIMGKVNKKELVPILLSNNGETVYAKN